MLFNKSKLHKLTNTNVKKIVCVNQLNFINEKSSGLGDFIRGCFFTMQLAKLLNLEFSIDISNHPMSKYIENSGKNASINYNNLEYIIGHNRPQHLWYISTNYIDVEFANKIIDKINNYTYSDTFAFFTNAFPIFYGFLDTGRQKIKSMLLPNTSMQEYVDLMLNRLKLRRFSYDTIHIRCGDKYLTDGEKMEVDFIHKVKKHINKLIVPNKRYLILSDSKLLKLMLKPYPMFHIIINPIEHLGGENMKSTESVGIMNTLADFYLMGYSNATHALTVYSHITGFSQYCSIINKIPFDCAILS